MVLKNSQVFGDMTVEKKIMFCSYRATLQLRVTNYKVGGGGAVGEEVLYL